MSITIGDTDIKNIYVGEGMNDYSAMQGPAPDGFHVPLNTEWQDVKDIRTALGGGSSDGTNFGIALKLPFAGFRNYTDAGVLQQGTYGHYLSSSRYSARGAYGLDIGSSTLTKGNFTRSAGFSVRCFKNSPTVPTSSWTKLYGTSIESGGIFWSSADGLISLSSDGQTWITIMDKNLGATTVWNNGDTLSEANCGKYYQWGNNYGFPRTGSVTTSSTQVNASTYGPGNYYSSSTFITYDGRWDTTDNGNLRGGETGVVKKGNVKEVYVGTTKVRPKTMPAGIYHNTTLGLISLSGDGSNWITIADKNLGATTVYNDGDTLSESNCGGYFQRGNNYMFPFSLGMATTTSQVNANAYGPGNYYSSNIFVMTDGRWDATDNGNLWGGVTGTNEAMQGPCASGFHVPSSSEFDNLYSILVNTFGLASNGSTMKTYLKMPFVGFVYRLSAGISNRDGGGYYWSSTWKSSTNAGRLIFTSSVLRSNDWARSDGYSVRPFKNDAVQPDSSRTKLY